MRGWLRTAWFAVTFIVFAYLVLRNTGLQPIVMADEWYYSSFSRLMPLAEVSIPSYLYLTLFKTTLSCGPGFLECARVMNAIVFVSSAPFIYFVARRFMSPLLASTVALLSILSPVNGYTAYFMPEALYFFAFWLGSWTMFRFHDMPGRQRAIEIGAVIGILALIKVHAIFLFPSTVLFMIYSVCSRPGSIAVRIKEAIVLVVLTLCTAAALRFGFGYLCAGRNGLSPFGTLYGAQAAQSNANHTAVAALLKLALFNLRGHILALALLFGVPLAVLITQIVTFKRSSTQGPQPALAVYSLLMLLALLAITIGFTASVAGSGQESNFRLHMRYYDFVFPLLIILAASTVTSSVQLPRALGVGIAAPIILIIAYGVVTKWQPYTPSFVDSPEFQGMTSKLKTFYLLSGAMLLSLFCWAYNQRLGARIFMFLFMPLYTVLAGVAINGEIRNGGTENQFDRAATVTRNYLNERQLDRVGIVGSDASGVFRARFHLDNVKVWQSVAAQGAPIMTQDIPTSIEWLLVLGEHPLPAGTAVHVQGPDFSIVELNAHFPGHFNYDFFLGDGGLIEKTEGLSSVESWGRWSEQKIVRLHFSKTLPQRFKLGLLAEAYGPNAGEDVIVKVGSATQAIRFDHTKMSVETTFETDGTQKIITFEVPEPTSPKSLGLSEDGRLLGIGFTKMTIDAMTSAPYK